MVIVNLADAKAKLSEYVDAAAKGDVVVICKWNRPVAELRGVAARRTEPRPIGLAKGQFTVPQAFFEPLPDDVLGAFEGEAPRRTHSRVAEARGPYRAKARKRR